MGIVHQLFVYSTIVFQKYNTFHMKWWSCFIRHYFEMLLFDEWLKWNIFHFFSTLNCQKESIDGKYIFQGAIIFIILGKGVPKTWPKTIILSNIRIDILNTTCLPCHDVLAKSTHKQPVKENLLFTLKLNRRILYGANQTE